MADRYDLRSQSDSNAYSSLPGTSLASEYVHRNPTDLKSKATIGRESPGCHPARWVHELLNNSFSTCDLFDRARHAQIDTTFDWQHQHRLVFNGNQSFNSTSTHVLSSLCLDCHFHFVFKFEWQEQHADDRCHIRQAAWPMRENMFPWHHLVWAGSEPDPMLAQYRSKYHPLLAREYFVCTAAPCTFQVTLDVLEPRMGRRWIDLLLDQDAILKELEKAKELEPHRYEGATEAWATEAPLNLNTYLKNIIESDPGKLRKVQKRNKRFSVIFGTRCADIFRQLEFEEEVVMNNGVDEGTLIPKAPEPLPTPTSTTQPATYRAYIEDVRAEVQCLIHTRGQGQVSGEQPSFINSVLLSELGIVEVANVESALVHVERYKLLGILPGQPKEAIVNAYFRQWEILPSQKRDLVEALVGVANDHGDDSLSAYAMTQSSVFESQLVRHSAGNDDGVATQAILYLGLNPPNTYGADTIINAFRKKLVEKPDDFESARGMLMVIAEASSSPEYQSSLLTEATGMSLETSRAILGYPKIAVSWHEYLQAGRKKIEANKSKAATELYLNAMDCIADNDDNAPLKAATAQLREKHLGNAVTTDESNKPGDISLPVGLNNIGNTCYLNSLLQYLYTVKAVRDIVLNYDDYKLELNDDKIHERRLGGNRMQMDRGEAVVAQAFVRELADLFGNLHKSDKVATRPSQRLANAVLLSTHSIIEDAKKAEAGAAAAATTVASEPAATSSTPPPLPARPSPSPQPATAANEHITEISEASSPGSSMTLVDTPDVAARAGTDETSDSSMMLSFDNKSTTELTARDHAVDTPTTGATSPNEQGSASKPSDADVIMIDDVEAPLTIDQKVLSALEHQTRSSGTEQQDVEEVIGSIINRLQAAIQPSSIDESTGIQLEKIMETFFVTTVNYTKKFDETTYQSEVGFDRSITAFPAPDGPCSLYDALGRNFDQQVLEESKLSRYTAIKRLPPVLHVLIQRSQAIGRKNNNPVIIPETLYLDRYMDAPHDSDDFKRRIAQWAVGSRLAELKQDEQQLAPPEDTPAQLESHEGELPPPYTETFDSSFDVDGPVDIDFPDAAQVIDEMTTKMAPPVGPSPLRTNPLLETQIRDLLREELSQRDEQLNAELDGLTKYPYRLQAVICHRGHLSSGHYWVWIHDFEDNKWRWYNDADVQENPDTEAVLKQLSSNGEPYYLCYVRDSDKDEHVNVPKRQPAVPDLIQVDSDGDVPLLNSSPTLSDGSERKAPVMEHDDVVGTLL